MSVPKGLKGIKELIKKKSKGLNETKARGILGGHVDHKNSETTTSTHGNSIQMNKRLPGRRRKYTII